jgi:uncharacterized protein YggE
MTTECASLMVEGVGHASAVPDLARVAMRVTCQGRKAGEARRACAQQAEAVLGQLERAGVPREDMQTAFYEVEQIRDERKRDEPVVGCRASTSIAVTLRKPEDLGRIIEDAHELGPNVAWTAAFDLSSEGQVKAEALGEAVKDAMRKAEHMAAAAGLQVKRVVRIKAAGIEEVLRARPEVRDFGANLSLAMEDVAAESMRSRGIVERGVREYQAKVTVELELGQ